MAIPYNSVLCYTNAYTVNDIRSLVRSVTRFVYLCLFVCSLYSSEELRIEFSNVTASPCGDYTKERSASSPE